jgi:hypothetical protein
MITVDCGEISSSGLIVLQNSRWEAQEAVEAERSWPRSNDQILHYRNNGSAVVCAIRVTSVVSEPK